MRKLITTIAALAMGTAAFAQNPVLPGYFADPTIKQFGDTYYIYATSDGVKLASGEPTVWVSKDMSNWNNHELDIHVPDGLTNCWAPDVVFNNGKYYYYMGNCQYGCNIYGYVSESPVGPFTPINNGDPVIPVGTAKKDLPCLDAQFFKDDDGSLYSYFGTWCTSFGGLGWAKVDPSDMTTLLKTGIIPTAQIPGVFEAAYMFKRNGKYILMYSSGDCRLSTYAVHYAWADSPEGPFHYGQNNPILATQADVDSPGHHSIIQIDGRYYIVYHRHDIPHSSGGEFRQVCINELSFSSDTVISKIDISKLFEKKNGDMVPLPVPVSSSSATSYYHLESGKSIFNPDGVDYQYLPQFASDNDNATMWKAASADYPQSLTLDLGKVTNIKRVLTSFEYSTYYYQYRIEVSVDNQRWLQYSDRTSNHRAGSPMIDDGDADARYIRLTVTGTQKSGLFPAVWEIKVFSERFDIPQLPDNHDVEEHSTPSTHSLLVDISADRASKKSITNHGTLGGKFSGDAKLTEYEGRKCWYFDGKSKLVSSFVMPGQMSWNGPYTVSVDVLNPEVGEGECLASWTSRDDMLMSSYAALYYGTSGYGAVAHGDGYVDQPYSHVPEHGKWHNIKVTFDGMIEKVYVDGVLDRELPISLFVKPDRVTIGTSGEPWEFFSGYISSVKIYDEAK